LSTSIVNRKYRVESQTKFTGCHFILYFLTISEPLERNEIIFSENGIVVNQQRRPLVFGEALVNKALLGVPTGVDGVCLALL